MPCRPGPGPGSKRVLSAELQMEKRAVGPDLEIVPRLEQATAGDLGAPGRPHADSCVAATAPVQTIDDGGPIPALTHCPSPSFSWFREQGTITANRRNGSIREESSTQILRIPQGTKSQSVGRKALPIDRSLGDQPPPRRAPSRPWRWKDSQPFSARQVDHRVTRNHLASRRSDDRQAPEIVSKNLFLADNFRYA